VLAHAPGWPVVWCARGQRHRRCYLEHTPSRHWPPGGVLVFDPMLATAGKLISAGKLERQLGVGGDRLRVYHGDFGQPRPQDSGRRRFPSSPI